MQMTRIPEQLVFSTIQPIMFVLLFAYVFGSAIPLADGGSYKEFLMAGIFAQIAAFATRPDQRRPWPGHDQGHRRPVPLAAHGPLGRAGRAHHRRHGEPVLPVRRDVDHRLLIGWSINNGIPKAIARLRPAPAVRLRDELDRRVDRPVGEDRSRWPTPPASSGCSRSRSCRTPSCRPPACRGSCRPSPSGTRSASTVSACSRAVRQPQPLQQRQPARQVPDPRSRWAGRPLILIVFVPLAVRKYRSATSR